MRFEEQKIKADEYILALYRSDQHAMRQLEVFAFKNKFNYQHFLKVELLAQTINPNLTNIRKLLDAKVDVNSILDGRTILHEACERSNVPLVEFLFANTSVDLNIADKDINYPLTIACRVRSFALVKLFLNSEICRYYGFKQTGANRYERKLDVIRLAIDNGDVELLDFLLDHAEHENCLITVNGNGLRELLAYANANKKQNVAMHLNRHLAKLANGKSLFKGRANRELGDLAESSQSITKIDSTTIISTVKLCKRYGIRIVEVAGSRKLDPGPHNFDDLLLKLQAAILRAVGDKYRIYTSAPKAVKEHRIISDNEYRGYAQEMFNNLVLPRRKGRFGTVYDEWRSSWYKEGTENLMAAVGLSVKDQWCLAMLAARDKNALAGVEFSDQDIADREEVLVRALVDCQRGYNQNNDLQHDMGGASDPSCVHGVFNRPLLSLSKLHDDINIETSALGWAGEVAQQALISFYNAWQDKEELNYCLSHEHFQLSDKQLCYIQNFYLAARTHVCEKISAQIGLIVNGGYLFHKEFMTTINSVESLPLPAQSVSTSVTIDLEKTADYAYVSTKEVLAQSAVPLEQHKLPNTTDSLFAAVLLSAQDQNLNIPSIVTVKQLRDRVANLIDVALFKPNDFYKIAQLKALKNITLSFVVCKIIRQHVLISCSGAEKKRMTDYVHGLRNAATADSLTLMLIAAIYDCIISTYSFDGDHVMTYSGQPLFLSPSVNADRLHIALHVRMRDDKMSINHNYANTLTRIGAWAKLAAFVKQLQISDLDKQLKMEHGCYSDYAVMSGRNIAGMEQVKIPGDGNCCFNAVLVAARHASSAIAYAIANHLELRALVKKELTIRLNAAKQALEANGSNEFLDNIYAAIDEFNELNDASLSTAEEYLAAIDAAGSWGGHLELQLMSNLFEINIIVHMVGRENPEVISSPRFNTTIILHHLVNHYNVLVEPGTWHGLDYGSSLLENQPGAAKKRLRLGCFG
jgi:hypothetical protein